MTDRAAEIVDAMAQVALVMGSIAGNAAHIAHARRTLYAAYIAEGFSEHQALELCKSFAVT